MPRAENETYGSTTVHLFQLHAAWATNEELETIMQQADYDLVAITEK